MNPGGSVVKRVLVATLVATTAAAQSIYTWTDEQGVEQFTDNPSTIPEKFRKKARVTSGGDINVVPAPQGQAAPAGKGEATGRTGNAEPRRPADDGPNKCVTLKKKVGDLEFSISQQKTEYEARERRCASNASRVTRRGQVVPVAGCSESNGPRQLKARLEADERKLEQLKDELRVVQIQGC